MFVCVCALAYNRKFLLKKANTILQRGSTAQNGENRIDGSSVCNEMESFRPYSRVALSKLTNILSCRPEEDEGAVPLLADEVG